MSEGGPSPGGTAFVFREEMARKGPAGASPMERDPRRALENRVLRFVRERGLLSRGERVLMAVSGGPDSTALFLILAALAPRLSLELRAAYFDHGLRGARAARREEAFLRDLVAPLGLSPQCGSGDVRAHARGAKVSLEQAAREMRYRFLERAAVEEGCTVIATGHTADDQVETVLLHLLRGSGLEGLAGMAPRGRLPVPQAGEAPALTRPLLALRRADTATYCRAACVSPLEDSTNLSKAFLRNRVRLELLPLLRQYNPRIDFALLRLANSARHDSEAMEKFAEDALATGASAGPKRVLLSRRRLAGLPEALQRHAVRLAVRRLVGDVREVHASHVEALVGALKRGTGHHLDLPRGLSLDVGYEEATLYCKSSARPAPVPEEAAALTVPGCLRWGRWRIESELGMPGGGGPPDDSMRAWLDADAVGEPLVVRSRRRGDRFQPLGMAQEKKLQDMLVDARVPRGQRDLVPLVCSPKGIAWVGGVRIAQWARIRPATRRVLKLAVRPAAEGPP